MPTRLTLAAVLVLTVFITAAGVLPAAQTAKPAPGPLAPFGVSEASVRTQLLESVSGGGEISNRLVGMIQDGYERIPVAMRAAATTAAFAWAKSYVSSPAFTTLYAQYRDEHKPAGVAVSTDSIDVEVQKQLADTIAKLEEIKKGLGNLDPVIRAAAIKNIDDQIAQYKSPESLRGMRLFVEAERTSTNAGNTKAAVEFADKWPADPKLYVKKKLEHFMAVTANIDYSLAQIWVKDPAGKTAGFLSPGLEDIPWETMRAIVAGKDAVDAARAFVSSWLKELP